MKRISPTLWICIVLSLPLMVNGQPEAFTWTTDGTYVSINGYTGTVGVVTIPGTISNMPVASIAANAFSGKTVLTNVTVPGSVTSIGSGAFGNCSRLTGITLSSGITSILDSAFFDCIRLTSVEIPGSVTNLGSGIFAYCTGLTNVTLPTGITSIGSHAFNYCVLLPGITIPPGVTAIGTYAFQNCSGISGITIPAGVTNIGDGAFGSCVSLTNITIPAGVTSIGNDAFQYCTVLACATLPDGLTSIGAEAFQGTRLANIAIPSGVTNIGPHAFALCDSLNGVFFKGNAPGVTNIVFDSDPSVTVYYLPGTTGWEATFDGVPAVLWNPLISSALVQNNGFAFNIGGTTNIPVVLEACTNLAAPVWQRLAGCTLTNGLVSFMDSDATNYPARFYRIRSP